MSRTVGWATVLIIIAGIIQSSLLSKIAIFHVIPDLALIILVYVSYVNGSMTGQITGFVSGIFLDFLSFAPFGFNALSRTIIGSLVGLLKGTFFLDIVIFPALLCAGATIIKAIIIAIIHFLFNANTPAYHFTNNMLWIEVAINAASGPFVFAFLKLFKKILMSRKEN
ncbi:rod shape-determining protein MreD [Gracilinema caldarium]|uniref:Rod shape-determining protein MreD n=1 Tax=Gracilinema caldarium (strain ATCC 51460 / DSM 7334 / H1) TaxID=744872 RepID=F8F3F7_GRAC1|nr:rod shape-determining protein MreD [Gracilinema caldarium]AEJ19533.1 rod shape-determining protein MreD [Gracilinema caldarium DSM 7334]